MAKEEEGEKKRQRRNREEGERKTRKVGNEGEII